MIYHTIGPEPKILVTLVLTLNLFATANILFPVIITDYDLTCTK